MTKIEWAQETWNPITGCSPISEGCQNCYAKRMANRLRGRYGYPKDDPFKPTFHYERMDMPLRWKTPRRVFVCSMADLFLSDSHSLGWEYIDDVFRTAIAAPQHIYIFLTKRPEPSWYYFTSPTYKGDCHRSDFIKYHPNHWFGVTAENQQRADERIPILLKIQAKMRFVSIEPMLGLVDLSQTATYWDDPSAGIKWVICGGETGPGARPMHPDWVRSIRDQCQSAGIPFFFKSWGEWIPRLFLPPGFIHKGQWGTFDLDGNWFPQTAPWNGCQGEDSDTREYVMYRVGKKQAGRSLDGRTWDEYPKV